MTPLALPTVARPTRTSLAKTSDVGSRVYRYSPWGLSWPQPWTTAIDAGRRLESVAPPRGTRCTEMVVLIGTAPSGILDLDVAAPELGPPGAHRGLEHRDAAPAAAGDDGLLLAARQQQREPQRGGGSAEGGGQR